MKPSLSRSWLNPFWILSLTILLLGGALSLYRLGAPSLWLDETYTWWFASMPWRKLLESVRLDGVNPPIYYIVVKAFIAPSGLNEFSLRLLSILTNMLAILFAMVIGYQIGGYAGSLASGWFWAFHPMALWYARDARPYSLTAALATGLMVLFIIVRRRSSSTALAFALITLTIGLLSHYFFFVFAASLICLTLADLRQKPTFFRRWTLTTLMSFVPLTLWLFWYFTQLQPLLGIGWIQAPKLFDLPATLWNLLSGYGGVVSWPSNLFGGLVSLLVAVALINDRVDRPNWRTLIIGIILPLGVVWLISQRRPVYHDRYFIVLLPMVLILVSSGAKYIWHEVKRRYTSRYQNLISAGIVLCFGAFGLWSGWQVHSDEKFAKENWRQLTDILKQKAVTQASLWFSEPEMSLPLGYYGFDSLVSIKGGLPPSCLTDCWWVLRQPYTATHAFSQTVRQADRPWEPELPENCTITDRWENFNGLILWHVQCR